VSLLAPYESVRVIDTTWRQGVELGAAAARARPVRSRVAVLAALVCVVGGALVEMLARFLLATSPRYMACDVLRWGGFEPSYMTNDDEARVVLAARGMKLIATHEPAASGTCPVCSEHGGGGT